MLFRTRSFTVTIQMFLLALIVCITSCNKADQSSPRVFASPDDAGNSLLKSSQSKKQDALVAIFGPESKELIYSGDAVQDSTMVDAFVAAYGQMHRWRKMPDNTQVLLVGADNFPFPIPLKENNRGQWFFDTAAGMDEILARRIGRNELAVIDICGALADAQAEYFSQRYADGSTNQYALKFISDPGTQNGLYWEPAEDQPRSPLGPLAAFASDEG